MEVKSLDGSSEIGGRDFDNILFEMVRFKIKNAGGMDILRMQNKRPCHRIRQKCEEIKIALSGSIQEWFVNCEYHS
jgi:molecular chaperone DnaK (HSP70)